MKKSELKNWLEARGGFTIEINHMTLQELLPLAEAAVKGNTTLTLLKTERLFNTEIATICQAGAGHVVFSDNCLDG